MTISQAESKRVVALVAHLRQIFRTASDGRRVRRPKEMDPAELVLAAASLRALLFDDTGEPILLSFLAGQSLQLSIEAIESNLSMLLLSVAAGDDDLHVSDFLADILFNAELRAHYALGEEKELLLAHTDPQPFASVMQRPELWAPTAAEDEALNSGLGMSNFGTPSQLITVTRREVAVADWGSVRMGRLKTIPIDRRTIILYVANKLGGAHYDSRRTPAAADDANAFRMLASVMDWEHQAVMHAGFVAVALACIEWVRTPLIGQLLYELSAFLERRQVRLRSGQRL